MPFTEFQRYMPVSGWPLSCYGMIFKGAKVQSIVHYTNNLVESAIFKKKPRFSEENKVQFQKTFNFIPCSI